MHPQLLSLRKMAHFIDKTKNGLYCKPLSQAERVVNTFDLAQFIQNLEALAGMQGPVASIDTLSTEKGVLMLRIHEKNAVIKAMDIAHAVLHEDDVANIALFNLICGKVRAVKMLFDAYTEEAF